MSRDRKISILLAALVAIAVTVVTVVLIDLQDKRMAWEQQCYGMGGRPEHMSRTLICLAPDGRILDIR